MSKGPGWLQRRLMEELQNSDKPRDTMDLAAAVFEQSYPSDAQHKSVHRALRKLADTGVIACLDKRTRWNTRQWASPEVHERVLKQLAALEAKAKAEAAEREEFFRRFVEYAETHYELRFTVDEARRAFWRGVEEGGQ
jgi:hypothetical protein